MTSISSQSSVGSGKSRRFLKLKLSLPVSSASLKHLSSGIFPDMVGFTCYKGNIGTLSRHLFRRLGDMLEISPRAITAHDWDALPISLWGLRGILACSRVFPTLQHISSGLLKGSTPPPPPTRVKNVKNGQWMTLQYVKWDEKQWNFVWLALGQGKQAKSVQRETPLHNYTAIYCHILFKTAIHFL